MRLPFLGGCCSTKSLLHLFTNVFVRVKLVLRLVRVLALLRVLALAAGIEFAILQTPNGVIDLAILHTPNRNF